MTAAFNLSQLANKVNTSGQLSLTTGVSGILPLASGGTGTATPSLVAGSNITITGTFPNQTITATVPQSYNGNSVEIFAGNGSWTVPTGITQAIITVIGGGGGGNGTTSGIGGQGGFAVVDVTGLSGSYNITIGTGGTGNSNTGNRAGSGNASSFGTIITCNGGQGALGNTRGNTGNVTVNAGTIIRQITGVATGGNQTFPNAYAVGNGQPATGTAAATWSTSSQYQPGSGAQNYTFSAMSGAVVIEY